MLLWLPGQVVFEINWDFHNQLSEIIGLVYPLPNQPSITIRKSLYTVYEFHLFFTFAQVKVHEIRAFLVFWLWTTELSIFSVLLGNQILFLL